MNGRPDALHENVCGKALSLLQLLLQLLPIQVVAPTLALGLQHEGLWVLLGFSQDVLCLLLFQVVQAPQPCSAAVVRASQCTVRLSLTAVWMPQGASLDYDRQLAVQADQWHVGTWLQAKPVALEKHAAS